VPPEKLERLPEAYFFNPQTSRLDVFDGVANSDWRSAPPFESAGGGLVSTIDDYFAFSRMMLNRGRHGREQVLSRAAVELMTTDHLTPEQRTGSEIFFGIHSSWGFGMAVDIRRDQTFRTPGRFGWDGGFGTAWSNIPDQDLTVVVLTQRAVDETGMPAVCEQVRTAMSS